MQVVSPVLSDRDIGAVRFTFRENTPLGPTLLNHRSCPLLRRVEYFILAPADLRALQGSRNNQAQFPSEDVRHQMARRLELAPASILVDAKHIANHHGLAVPV